MTAVSAKIALHNAATGMRTYKLSGVAIRSDIRLPGIPEAEAGRAALAVEEGRPEEFQSGLASTARPHAQAGYEQVELPTGSYIRWQQDLEYLVSADGGRIAWGKINPELSDAAQRSFTFGHVLSHA